MNTRGGALDVSLRRLRTRVLWRLARSMGHDIAEIEVAALVNHHDDGATLDAIKRRSRWYWPLFRWRS